MTPMVPRTASRATPLPDITRPGWPEASCGSVLGFGLCCTGACRDTGGAVVAVGVLTLSRFSSTLALGRVTVMTDMLALGVTKTVTVGDCVPVDDTGCDFEAGVRVWTRTVDFLVGNTAVGTDSKGVKGVDGWLRLVGVGVRIRAGVSIRVLGDAGVEHFDGRS